MQHALPSNTRSHWSHEAAFPSDPASVLRARRFVSVHLADYRLFGLMDDVRLAVSELATNAVRHAGTPFNVALEREPACLTLRVQDTSDAEPVPLHPDLLDVSGRGIWLLGLVSSGWGVDHLEGGVKSVWATFDVAPDVPAPSSAGPRRDEP